jgi:RecB family endonuclease NucS
MNKAISELDILIVDREHNMEFFEAKRLKGKREGIQLAKDYFLELWKEKLKENNEY